MVAVIFKAEFKNQDDEFCEDGETMDGSMSVSGTFNEDGSGTIAISIDSLTFSEEGESINLTGEFSVTFNSNDDSTVTMNLVIQDSSGKTYKTENYTIFESGDGTRLTLNGRLYDSKYGYVDIVTLTEFQFDSGDEFPSVGVLVVTGATGTSVRLTVIDDTEVRLEVDLNGDGDYSDPGENLRVFDWEDISL